METLLNMPDFTCREAARYIGVHDKTLYAWHREGKIQLTLDCTGQLRVPYGEVYRVMREREVTAMS
jgi:excisionase family DNA binding protein